MEGLDKVVNTVGAIAAVAATIAGVISAQRAENARLEAVAVATAFEARKYSDELQYKVFEKIENSVTADAPGRLIVGATYLSFIQDEQAKQVWCAAITQIAQAKASSLTSAERNAVTLAKDCAVPRFAPSADLEQRRADVDQSRRTEPSGDPAFAPALEQAQVRNAAPRNPVGWDIDVFWCADGGSREQARAGADRLAKVADERSRRLGGELLGRVRLIRVEKHRAPKTDAIYADVGEEPFAAAIAKEVGSATGRPPQVQSNAQPTPWYLGVFLCGAERS